MGRRSINTTKSGKYMNPTDQARKEARKKELKKNKKQRQMVRAAVLKGKDPGQILEEMEKIDEMEYNVFQPSPLNEKVLREKRKKLKETFDRVMRLYHNDDPDLFADLKRKEVEYEKRRLKKQQFFESVKHAQTVQIDEIPLPQMAAAIPTTFPALPRLPAPAPIPVPQFLPAPPIGILKKGTDTFTKPDDKLSHDFRKREPPGCPAEPPPNLLLNRLLDTDVDPEEPKAKKIKTIRFSDEIKPKDVEERKFVTILKKLITMDPSDIPKPTSLQQRMLAISGQNIDDFMKEMEQVHKSKEQDKDTDSDQDSSGDDSDNSDTDKRSESDEDDEEPPAKIAKVIEKLDKVPDSVIPLPPVLPPPPHAITLPSGPPPPPIGLPPSVLFRPPPLRPALPGLALRMPPGPPPVRPGMPSGPPNGLPPRVIRIPPGPPPGMPPPRMMHHHLKNPNPNMNQVKDSKGVTTITAKPQIRNLSADVTRFLPSTLRIKKDFKQKAKPKTAPFESKLMEQNKGSTKDDAYMQFMREMQGLL